jgi:hypothetical protein
MIFWLTASCRGTFKGGSDPQYREVHNCTVATLPVRFKECGRTASALTSARQITYAAARVMPMLPELGPF